MNFLKKNGLFKSRYWIKLLLESHNLSKGTQWFMEVDWKEKFTKPTEQVLKELNMTEKPQLWLVAKSYIKHNYKGEQ